MTDDRIAQLLTAAGAAQKAGRADEAVRHFEAVLALAPDHPIALNSLGVQALASGDARKAIAFTTRAARADPGEPVLWINLARAQRESGDVSGERDSLDRALGIDPRLFIALLRKAQLCERLGEKGEAMRLWGSAMAMAPPAEQRPLILAKELAQGQAFLEAAGQAFGDELDAGLADARATLDGGERRRFDACVDHMLGRRRIYHSECAGVHFPFLPADEFFERRYFPWLDVLEERTPAIRAELEALAASGDEGFVPYVSQPSNTPENLWSRLNDRLDWSAYYLWRFGERIEAARAACPVTMAALDALPLLDIDERGPTAFFSILRPQTRIPPHTGVTNARAIVHLPLVVPEGCGFRVGGETRRWKEGRAFVFDDTIEHEAWNDSDQMRAVLILDVWNPHLSAAERDLLRTYFKIANASAFRPEMPAGL